MAILFLKNQTAASVCKGEKMNTAERGKNTGTVCKRLYLLVDKINRASRVDVHKVNISVVVDELCTPRHGVGEAALHLETQFVLQNQGNLCSQ